MIAAERPHVFLLVSLSVSHGLRAYSQPDAVSTIIWT
jgi:hypothetical protein